MRICGSRRGTASLGEGLGYAVENHVLPAGEVGVEGRGFHASVFGDAGDGRSLQTAPRHQLEGGGCDLGLPFRPTPADAGKFVRRLGWTVGLRGLLIDALRVSRIIHRRVIDHSHSSNIHAHIGAPLRTTSDYPYWMHCTGDIRTATFKVGDKLVHDRGHLTALDDPAVLAVAAKYPDRPGLSPEPKNC